MKNILQMLPTAQTRNYVAKISSESPIPLFHSQKTKKTTTHKKLNNYNIVIRLLIIYNASELKSQVFEVRDGIKLKQSSAPPITYDSPVMEKSLGVLRATCVYGVQNGILI